MQDVEHAGMTNDLKPRPFSNAGVLYTPPPQLFTVAPASGPYAIPTPSVAHEQPPAPSAAAPPRYAHPGLGAITRRGRSARRDPLEPKQNKTPFNFFSIDARARAKAEHPQADQKVLPAPSLPNGMHFSLEVVTGVQTLLLTPPVD